MLQGISVVEVGFTRGAAFAGKLLADAGAAVTKIDVAPGTLPEAARIYFDADKSASLSVEALSEVITTADVVITDVPMELQASTFGQPLDVLRKMHPQLVVCELVPLHAGSGHTFGSCGELAMQAGSGLLHMTGAPDREPLGIPYHLGCLQLGIHGAGATMAALLRRRITGKTPAVRIVGADVLASYLRIYGAVSEYYDVPLLRDGPRAPGSGGRYPFGLFPCADGYVAMIARTPRDWDNILAMMGNPAWSQESRYQNLHGIAMEYPEEVDRLVEPWLRERTRAEIMVLAQQHAIPVAPVKRVDEVVEDKQLVHRKFFRNIIVDGNLYAIEGLPWITEPANEPVASASAGARSKYAQQATI
ncbi:CoA transferase [Arthrobacter globiformis]|uniref:CoA transferase n=1 Tax=Arthrobacter globiformis TaxID=1665 RepID=UPI00278EDEC6|nr:CoA transferase [Arthrobacter globiformis]MDQ0616662.1 CoA:oxalate CoA-transferase [Arthrobacter globiformis]